jgi:RNA recognition motif-containing protein
MTKVYVANLAFKTTADALWALFAQHGQVESARLMVDRDTGRPRGFAFVEMPDAAAASTAIQSLNGSDFNGRALEVGEALSQDRPAKGSTGARRY